MKWKSPYRQAYKKYDNPYIFHKIIIIKQEQIPLNQIENRDIQDKISTVVVKYHRK